MLCANLLIFAATALPVSAAVCSLSPLLGFYQGILLPVVTIHCGFTLCARCHASSWAVSPGAREHPIHTALPASPNIAGREMFSSLQNCCMFGELRDLSSVLCCANGKLEEISVFHSNDSLSNDYLLRTC